MGHFCKFAIVQLVARPPRDERLNVAVIVFHETSLDVCLPRRLDKVRAMSYGLDAEHIRESLLGLQEIDCYLRSQSIVDPEESAKQLGDLSPFGFSRTGSLQWESSTAYESEIHRILATLVDPEPGTAKIQPKRTKLLSLVKSLLRAEGVLASKGEDITAHRVVSNYTIAEGLAADLALKNSKMHIIETVDALSSDTSQRKVVADIAISALVLEQARMTFGKDFTSSRLIYEASASLERITGPSLMAAQNQGAELVNWASHDDRNKLITTVASLAQPKSPRRGKVGTEMMVASAQPRLALN